MLDTQQLVYDVSGAGNNWAHGHHGYGPQYREQLLDKLRTTAEACDSLQSFMLLHSLGGGTGSGLGTYTLGLLQVREGSIVTPSPSQHHIGWGFGRWEWIAMTLA